MAPPLPPRALPTPVPGRVNVKGNAGTPVFLSLYHAPRGPGSSQQGGEISAAGPPVEQLPKSTCAALVSGQ